MTDVTLTSGTSRNLAITVDNNATPPAAVDLTSLDDMAWIVLDGARGVIQKILSAGDIVVTDAANGKILVSMNVDDTSPAFGVGSTTETKTYTHEARLWFSDGTQEVVMTGSLIITPTTSWKGNVAWTSGADRTVFVQGRY